ncbi:hypothetical protein DM02DRAFT_569786 [Periconia macrospinosa]|uniref:MI domain-containing protein n=1 Tax=Periconia macrospinosa TaxID=97972 RepID=A0A2V1DEF2_9PLEO|nr:hypothetical protein DM02DRAFT_569786 [Periconia macrospinosa]
MHQRQNGGPQLPKALRDQIGDTTSTKKRGPSRPSTSFTRKDRRKAERQGKKTQKSVQPKSTARYNATPGQPQPEDQSETKLSDEEEDSSLEVPSPKDVSDIVAQSHKPSKKTTKEDKEPDRQSNPKVSRALRDRLAQDDAEISALEKRLGIKRKNKTKGFDDGLDDVLGGLGGLDSEDEDLFAYQKSKRKRDGDDDWLASKRRRAAGDVTEGTVEQGESASDEEHGFHAPSSEDELDERGSGSSEESDFEGFDEETEGAAEVPRIRENPYIAPIAADAPQPGKYIPPALRAPPSSDSEALSRLRRQIQGLLNRLSDANIMTIVRDVETIYQNNPRGYVTSILIDLLVGLLADETVLLDTFLILHSGFLAAIYKVIGPDFGAQIIERIVSVFDKNYQRNKEGFGKQTTNLMSVMAELYCFQTIGSKIIFDYLRQFLDELSEINTELILRVVRVAGSHLRQDDPSSLKDIVLLLQKQVTKAGEGNFSVRTRFMIETINDLKNNKMKTGITASAVATEHVVRMKKQLGTLNSQNLKGSEPLRIGLNDIKDTEKKGKWWLVGASWRNDAAESNEPLPQRKEALNGESDVHGQTGEVDLFQLAREQRMNTDVRRAIFITIMSASDYKDAHVRLLKLNLKKAQETEIPRVIVHCAGCESTYNPYYTLLAQKFCMDHKSRKCFQFALWDVFKSLGERQDGEEDSSEDEDQGNGPAGDFSLRKLVNLGKLYGTLMAKDSLSITTLKPLNFPYLKAKTSRLVEIMLVTAILESQKKVKGKKDGEKKRDDKALLNVFINVDGAPEMIAGLQYFMKKVVGKTEITASKREKDSVRWACKQVTDMLERLMATTTLDEE